MRGFLATMIFGTFVLCLMGCTPRADTTPGTAAPVSKDAVKGAEIPPPPPKK